MSWTSALHDLCCAEHAVTATLSRDTCVYFTLSLTESNHLCGAYSDSPNKRMRAAAAVLLLC